MPQIYSPLDLHYTTEAVEGLAAGSTTEFMQGVCKLIIHTAEGKMGGTGFFVHPRVVVTAGHCVLYGSRQFYPKVEILPALNGVQPYGKITAMEMHVSDKYYRRPDWDLDFGFLVLEEAYDVPLFSFCEEAEERYCANGYKVDDDTFDEAESGIQEWHSGMIVEKRYKYRMHLKGTLVPGFSGAPLYFKRDGASYCSGIHSASKPGASIAVRVTEKTVLSEFRYVLAKYQLQG